MGEPTTTPAEEDAMSDQPIPGERALRLLASLTACDQAVLDAMGERSGSIAELAARTGYTEDEVEEAFAKFEDAGLIHRRAS